MYNYQVNHLLMNLQMDLGLLQMLLQMYLPLLPLPATMGKKENIKLILFNFRIMEPSTRYRIRQYTVSQRRLDVALLF